MYKEPTSKTENLSHESQDKSEKLIADIQERIAIIKQLRICIALYLLAEHFKN
jgi:hypothetical protein